MTRRTNPEVHERRVRESAERKKRLAEEHRQRVARRVTKVGEKAIINRKISRLQSDARFYRKAWRETEAELSRVRGCCICRRWEATR